MATRRRIRIAYEYVSFTLEQTQNCLETTLEAIAEWDVPVEIAYSPSKCACLRVKAADMEDRLGIPSSTEGTYWPTYPKDTFPYLFKEWEQVPQIRRRRRRRRAT